MGFINQRSHNLGGTTLHVFWGQEMMINQWMEAGSQQHSCSMFFTAMKNSGFHWISLDPRRGFHMGFSSNNVMLMRFDGMIHGTHGT
jgi:hypothetical protein